jgi:hypothetical protein
LKFWEIPAIRAVFVSFAQRQLLIGGDVLFTGNAGRFYPAEISISRVAGIRKNYSRSETKSQFCRAHGRRQKSESNAGERVLLPALANTNFSLLFQFYVLLK